MKILHQNYKDGWFTVSMAFSSRYGYDSILKFLDCLVGNFPCFSPVELYKSELWGTPMEEVWKVDWESGGDRSVVPSQLEKLKEECGAVYFYGFANVNPRWQVMFGFANQTNRLIIQEHLAERIPDEELRSAVNNIDDFIFEAANTLQGLQ